MKKLSFIFGLIASLFIIARVFGASTGYNPSVKIGGLTGSVFVLSGSGVTTSSNPNTITISGGSGSGSVSTSSAVSQFNFPYWANTTGGLNGTSTLSIANATSTQLLQNGAFNASGTITQNGTAVVLTTRNVNSGGILSGGGDLSADRTISLSTSTLYSEFSANAPATFNTSTGAIGWTNSLGFLTNASITATSPITWSAGNVIACATCSTLSTSSAGIAQAIPLWTSASAFGNSLFYQNAANTSVFVSSTPNATATMALLTVGATPISNGQASGTWFGIIEPTSSNADMLNFENYVTSTANGVSVFKVASSGAMTAANITDTGVKSALHLADSNGLTTAYGGTGTCSAGQAMTTLSATGVQTCAAFGSGNGTLTTSTQNTAPQIAIGDGGTAIRFSSSFTATTSTGVLAAPTGTYSGNLAVGTTTNANLNGQTNILNVNGTTTLNGSVYVGSSTVYQFVSSSTNTKTYVGAGTSSFNAAAAIGGTIAWSATSTGNGAGASTSLMTYTIPTSTFEVIGDEVDVFAGGTITNNSDSNKEITLAINSSTVFDSTNGTNIIPASVACNWFMESRGTLLTGATTSIWSTQFTDSCNSALTDDSGDAGNATANTTSTNPVQINVYGNATTANSVKANYFRVVYNPAP